MSPQEGSLRRETNDGEAPEIRVTDRRRVYLDDGTTRGKDATAEGPNLKPSYVEELEARTRAAEAKVLEVQSRFDQLRAQLQKETDETRQRLNRAAADKAERERAHFVASLLPVLDNLLRATEAAEKTDAVELISEGVRKTAESFEKALREAGVEPINAVGAHFDPEQHEAVETMEVEPELEGKVVEEYTRGYRMGSRLLRPARVKVGAAARSGSASR
jgi:molecular chaperone GrpE